jgi:general secretion pathway protein G
MVTLRRSACPACTRGRRTSCGRRGHTFVELLVASVILAILATGVMPVAAVMKRREKEIQLRRALRNIREALDAYHDVCMASLGAGTARPKQDIGKKTLTIKVENDPSGECWPKDLDVLVEGVDTNTADYQARFLRRIPRDPFVPAEEENDQHGWILRSTQDRIESSVGWDRTNVFDVRSASKAHALDHSKYEDW